MAENTNELKLTNLSQVYEEGLIFDRSRPGRKGFSLPDNDRDLPDELPEEFVRKAPLRLPETGEMEVVRHYTRLSTWNYSIDMNLYPLGSCTMKYNPRINETVASLEHLADLHPDIPEGYDQGALELLWETQDLLCKLTDMSAVTLQPAAGAHGELTGLFLVRAALKDRGENRGTVLVPDSAHGTNPATCTLAGYKVKQLKSREDGRLSLEDIRASLNEDVACLMITNPSTLGIFESGIREIADLLHENGSYLYMDGANYNALIGKTSLSRMGVDVSHLNLHKTFGTPHGGGGPGAAAVVVGERLKDFLPGPIVEKEADGSFHWLQPRKSIGRMKAGPGHTGVVLKALAYMLTYGNRINLVAEHSLLNANLIRKLLEKDFELASTLDTMHEAVFNDATLKEAGGTTLELAKSLIDYGYHPPTVFFPLSVSGAMMIEPTETESPETIRHFALVMKDILRRMKEGDPTIKEAPLRAFRGKLDEARAARQPVLNYFTKPGAD